MSEAPGGRGLTSFPNQITDNRQHLYNTDEINKCVHKYIANCFSSSSSSSVAHYEKLNPSLPYVMATNTFLRSSRSDG
jgi:hypothetical protein